MTSSVSLPVRAAALGVAAGARSSLGVAAPLAARSSRVGAAACLAGIGVEIVLDKLPRTPSRLLPPGPQIRAASGGVGGLLLSRRDGASLPVLALTGLVGAAAGLAGTYAGAAWRKRLAADRPDWQGAVVEDAAALLLAAVAVRSQD